MTTAAPRRIPAFINAESGTADAAKKALDDNGTFDVQQIKPEQLEGAIEAALAEQTPRVLVAGGDGTIGTAASVLISGSTELAILPGGTLNHFARDLGISIEPEAALATATNGTSRGVDVGMVNGKIFLNTSSVGAYVQFVRSREFLERRFGYRLASAIAAVRLLFAMRRIAVELEVDGQRRIYRSPLVFIGVSERELQLPTLGNRVPGGKRGLHVIVVRSRSRARLFAIALNAVARGVKTAAQSPELDSFIVDKCTITRKHAGRVALDGEVVSLDSTLEYELKRDALRVVCP